MHELIKLLVNISVRRIAMLLITATLCAIMIIIVVKLFMVPAAFTQLKDLILLITGGFIGMANMIMTKSFDAQARNDAAKEETPK